MKPYNAIQMPPITHGGIESINATRGVKNEKIMQPMAVAKLVITEAFLVSATHATDSHK